MKRFDIRLEGFDPGAGEPPGEALARLFGMAPQSAERLVQSLPRIVKRDVEDAQAQRILEALQGAGAQVSLEASPIRPAAVMPVGKAAAEHEGELPDVASPAPAAPAVAKPTVVHSTPPRTGGTLVITAAAAIAGVPKPRREPPSDAPGQATPAVVADSGSTTELRSNNDPWGPTSSDIRSAETAALPVGAGVSAAPPAPPAAAPVPAEPGPRAPAAPLEVSTATPQPPVSTGDRVSIPIPVPALVAAAVAAPMPPAGAPVAIPAPVVPTQPNVASAPALIDDDPNSAFPGIDLSQSPGVRSNDSMELTHDPLEFLSQPPRDPTIDTGASITDIDLPADSLALPASDAPPPLVEPAAPAPASPTPAPRPVRPVGMLDHASPVLGAMPALAAGKPVGDHPTLKSFGVLGVVGLLTLFAYVIFVM